MGFGLVNGFVEELHTVIISNYSAITNSRTSHFTAARIKSSQSAISLAVVVW
jgi:hypothetical protein